MINEGYLTIEEIEFKREQAILSKNKIIKDVYLTAKIPDTLILEAYVEIYGLSSPWIVVHTNTTTYEIDKIYAQYEYKNKMFYIDITKHLMEF